MTVLVICICGLPGSGKSTICTELVSSQSLRATISKLLPDAILDVLHISLDELEQIERVGSDFDPAAWRRARQEAHSIVNEAYLRCRPSTELLTVLLLDDNFFYKSMRKRFKPHGIIYVSRALTECILLNQARHKPLPEPVIQNMALVFEEPEPSDKTSVLTVVPTIHDSKDVMVQCVAEACMFWRDAIGHALDFGEELYYRKADPPLPSERDMVLDRCEYALRRCISNLATTKDVSSDTIKRACAMKKSIMKRFKSLIAVGTSPEEAEDIISSAIVELNYILYKV